MPAEVLPSAASSRPRLVRAVQLSPYARNPHEETRAERRQDARCRDIRAERRTGLSSQIEIARTGVAQAEENLRITLNAYKAGTETLTNLLDAETLNRKMQDGLSSAIADYQIKKSDYIRKTR